MRIRISSAAEAEFAEAATYYEQAEEGLGDKFITSVTVAVSKIKKHPALGRLRRKAVRSLAVNKFPYNIVYEVGSAEIVIYAIAHQSRLPDYWIDRVS